MRRPTILAVAALLVAVMAAGWVIWSQLDTQQQAVSLADQVADACKRGGPGAAELGAACQKAAEVKDSPVPTPPPTPTLDPAAVRQAARAAVLDYCGQETEPCRGADGATPDIDLLVDLVLARVPVPQDGRDAPPVTDRQLYAQFVAYCSLPSEPCRGPAGADGETPPCMSQPAQCQGANGQPGRGVVSHEYLLVDGRCVERTYYTADPSPVDVEVGAALCESSTPTPDPTDPPTETP